MDLRREIRELKSQNESLKTQLRKQAEQHESERAALIARNDSLQHLLEEERRRNRENSSPFHHSVSAGASFSFGALEAEAVRLEAETKRICSQRKPIETTFHFLMPTPAVPSIGPTAPPEQRIHDTEVLPVVLSSIPDEQAPVIGQEEKAAVSDGEGAAMEKTGESGVLAPSIQTDVETTPEKQAAIGDFVARPMSNEASFNDDFFNNAAPSPPPGKAKGSKVQISIDSDSPPPEPMKRSTQGPPAKGSAKTGRVPKLQKRDSVESDPFGGIDLSLDIDSPSPTGHKKKEPQKQPAKRTEKTPSKSKPPGRREENSAEQFEFDPDQIIIDFD
jgi:hypothetical protein